MSYYNDYRVRAAEKAKWYEDFFVERMVGTVHVDNPETGEPEVVEVPAYYVVCPTCQGKGKHTNPSIDCDGLSPEDQEDEGFIYSYLVGHYDVACYGCNGTRVVPVIAREGVPKYVLDELDRREREEEEFLAISAAERRFGC